MKLGFFVAYVISRERSPGRDRPRSVGSIRLECKHGHHRVDERFGRTVDFDMEFKLPADILYILSQGESF